MLGAITERSGRHLFDPFDEALIVAPYPCYQRLRLEDPVHWCAPLRVWVLSRMEEVRSVLNDRNFEAVDYSKLISELARRAGRDYSPLVRVLDATLFSKEGEAHQQMRRTVSMIINRIPLSQLESIIDDIAASLAGKLSTSLHYDAIAEFAQPLPQFVMARILGLREHDVLALNELLTQLTLLFDPGTLDIYDNINAEAAAALRLLQARVAEATNGNEENGLSDIYNGAVGSEPDRLARAAAIALFTYRVGVETTMSLIGFLTLTLIERPWLRQMVSDDPAYAQVAVSEVLRLESSVQRSVRICRQSQMVGGKTIQAGDRVMLLLGSANRDPAAFAVPNDLSTEHKPRPDVAFGGGHHYCLGATLAKLEGRIALKHLVKLPPFERGAPEKWYAGQSIRRLAYLPVRVVPVLEAGL
jgi:pimeloyl-[acyl-carrier protein] synthase